jgi:transcription elongation factor/antiterminator RfaH
LFDMQRVPRLPWYALLVRSRRENQVFNQLLGQGYECFLPVYKSERRWSDRVKEVQQPLFPGYLFCRFDIHNRGPVLMASGVHQIVGVGHTPVPVADTEIESIRQALASGLPSQPWLYLQVGQRVRVHHGNLNNIEGILISFKGGHRVVLSVSLLQRSVAMEVDLSWVTPVNEAKRMPLTTGQDRTVTAPVVPVLG